MNNKNNNNNTNKRNENRKRREKKKKYEEEEEEEEEEDEDYSIEGIILMLLCMGRIPSKYLDIRGRDNLTSFIDEICRLVIPPPHLRKSKKKT